MADRTPKFEWPDESEFRPITEDDLVRARRIGYLVDRGMDVETATRVVDVDGQYVEIIRV